MAKPFLVSGKELNEETGALIVLSVQSTRSPDKINRRTVCGGKMLNLLRLNRITGVLFHYKFGT